MLADSGECVGRHPAQTQVIKLNIIIEIIKHHVPPNTEKNSSSLVYHDRQQYW